MGSELVKRAVDLIVCVGSRDFGGRVVPASAEAPDVKIVRLGMDTASMSRNYPTDLALVGDTKEGLKDLSAAVEAMLTKSRLTSVAKAVRGNARDDGSGAGERGAARRKTFGRSPRIWKSRWARSWRRLSTATPSW